MSESALKKRTDSTENQTDEMAFTADDVLTVISNERRRYLLEYLQNQPGPVQLSKVAEQIAAWENDTTENEVTYDQRKSVYTSLLQFHCPKMDDLDVVEFDQRDATVELAENSLQMQIELTSDDGVWRFVFSYLSISVGVGLAAWAFSVPPFGALSLSTVLGSLLSAATASTFIYLYLRANPRSISFHEFLSEIED